MPKSIRIQLKELTARQSFLEGLRAHVDEQTQIMVDMELDDLRVQIDSLVEVHSK